MAPETPFPDFYAVLEIQFGASTQEIRKAWMRLVKQWQSKANSGDRVATERLQQIHEAYTLLSDPSERAEYDRAYEYYRQHLEEERRRDEDAERQKREREEQERLKREHEKLRQEIERQRREAEEKRRREEQERREKEQRRQQEEQARRERERRREERRRREEEQRRQQKKRERREERRRQKDKIPRNEVLSEDMPDNGSRQGGVSLNLLTYALAVALILMLGVVIGLLLSDNNPFQNSEVETVALSTPVPMVNSPPVTTSSPTHTPTVEPTSTSQVQVVPPAGASPTSTVEPTSTSTPVPIPTSTPVPTATPLVPTATPIPPGYLAYELAYALHQPNVDASYVQSLLQAGAPLDCEGISNCSYLTVEYNGQTYGYNRGRELIEIAINRNVSNVVLQSLVDAGVDVRGIPWWYVLNYEADAERIQILLDAGLSFNGTGPNGHDAVSYAVRQELSNDVIQLIYESGINYASANVVYYALSYALRQPGVKDEWVLQLLSNANLHIVGYAGLLELALQAKLSNDVLSVLIQSGVKTSSPSVLYHALQDHSIDADRLRILLKSGVPLNARHDTGYTPLDQAVINNYDAEILSLLISAGADVLNSPYVLHELLDHYQAVTSGQVRVLIGAGVDVNAFDILGRSPLDVAAENNLDAHVLQALISAGASVADSPSVLHKALDHPETVAVSQIQVLINAGADVDVPDEFGRLPLDIAMENNLSDDILALLR